MTLLALRALLGSGVSKLWAIVSHASFAQILAGALALFALVEHFELAHSRHEAAKWQHQYTEEHAGRLADRTAYTAAQTQAAAQNKLQVAAKESEYKRNSDNEKDAYARDHAELVRLRAQRDAAAKRPSGSTDSPKDSGTRPEPDGHGVPVPSADDLQTTRDNAADIELRLMHLQNYVEGLLKINPNN